MSDNQAFVQWFRGAAPYIKAHRKKTFVIMIADEFIHSAQFIGLVHDLALLNHLGVKLVILHGSRKSIDEHLRKNNIESSFHDNIRISDSKSLPFIVQAINEIKTYLESHLSMGLPNTPMSGSNISLVSGNFVTGMPLGVIDGVDMQHSGRVRDVKHEVIKELLDQNHVILLSNIGYSRTGEIFNLPAEELAGEVASALQAEKLIFVQHSDRDQTRADTLTTSDCQKLIDDENTDFDYRNLLRQSIRAIQSKVKRVHIINQQVDGGLIVELFTRNGCGTMITNLFYEGIRDADIDDIGGILSLIQPLEANGTLIERSREQLELEIGYFQVVEKDGMIIACVACIPDEAHLYCELACLAVHEDYRNAGLGEQLLEKVEQLAGQGNFEQIITLTTRTSHWFLEHGFVESPELPLPSSKKTVYHHKRSSKILSKQI